jgi:hypothetical protein
MRIRTLTTFGLAIVLILSTGAHADSNSLPLDTSDNQSPALISATLENSTASANSANSIILVIKDDKNSMFVGHAPEFEAPPGTGTVYINEGFESLIAPPELISRTKLIDGIQETWKIRIKVPSVVGIWKGYRVDFMDLAKNSVQFINKSPDTCSNSLRYKYPNPSAGTLDSTACAFNLKLTVTPEVSGNIAKVTSPEYEVALQQLETNKKALITALQNLDPKIKRQYEESASMYLNFVPDEIKPGLSVPMMLTGSTNLILSYSKTISLLTTKILAPTKQSKGRLTITCIKGKLTKKVTAVNPKCPVGYKKK